MSQSVDHRFNRKNANKSASGQKGLSLIELMVALSLGVFIIAGVIQVFSGSRQSYEVIRAQSVMQEAGRFGLFFLTRSVEMAGYANLQLGAVVLPSPDTTAALSINTIINKTNGVNHWPADTTFVQHAVIAGQNNASGTIGSVAVKADTDVLYLRTQGDSNNNVDNAMTDCHGNSLDNTVGNFVEMIFFVGNDNQLYCAATNAGVSSALALVSGIENMQIQYGTYSSETFSPELFQNADDVTAWDKVSTMRIGLLSVSDTKPLSNDSVTYTLLDETVSITDKSLTGSSRQVFEVTIPVRSKLSRP